MLHVWCDVICGVNKYNDNEAAVLITTRQGGRGTERWSRGWPREEGSLDPEVMPDPNPPSPGQSVLIWAAAVHSDLLPTSLPAQMDIWTDRLMYACGAWKEIWLIDSWVNQDSFMEDVIAMALKHCITKSSYLVHLFRTGLRNMTLQCTSIPSNKTFQVSVN